jgi:hypothetical protein
VGSSLVSMIFEVGELDTGVYEQTLANGENGWIVPALDWNCTDWNCTDWNCMDGN